MNRAAHSLKGATYYFAAPIVTAAAQRLEHLAAAGDLTACVEAAADLLQKVEQLQQAIERLVATDAAMVAQESA